jgi:aldehyde:ferredoxin oxidoreductase
MQPILIVDLESGNIDKYEIPNCWQDDFIGGASLAARILYDHLVQDLDPLAPEAPLLFMTGPLTGTSGPAVGRFVICGRSPATRLWGESNCGGFWGPELRKAGFDGLWLKGRANHPVYLWIHNQDIEIRDARHIWGQDTYTTQSEVKQEIGFNGIRVASIGPGGEAQLPFALILCDHGRVAGRTGMGAIMGTKNVKAIAVKGNNTIPLSNPNHYNEIRSAANRYLREDMQTIIMRELGTSATADYFDYIGELPKRYFRLGKPYDELRTSGVGLKESILTGVSACHACVIACGRVVSLNKKDKRKGPEYETMAGFGPNLLINDPIFVTLMGELCDRHGIDTISMSNLVGLVFHLFDKGIITEKDTDGLCFRWGDQSNVEQLINLTIRREGFGCWVAEGAKALASRFNAFDEAVHVNGLEAPYHDPRGGTGMALVYATSPRGACHNQSDYYIVDLGQVESKLGMEYFDRHAGSEKAANVAIHQNWITLFNSLVMCLFAHVPPDTVLELTNAASGSKYSSKKGH